MFMCGLFVLGIMFVFMCVVFLWGMYMCLCGYFDCAFVVFYVDIGVAVLVDVYGGVGAVLDVFILRYVIYFFVYIYIVRRICDR